MDSKQLYIATRHLSSTIKWDNWIHFGTGDEIKIDIVDECIDKVLTDRHVNIVLDRQDSGRQDKIEIKRRILGLLGQQDFQLWDESLTKVIEFNKIGSLRTGRK